MWPPVWSISIFGLCSWAIWKQCVYCVHTLWACAFLHGFLEGNGYGRYKVVLKYTKYHTLREMFLFGFFCGFSLQSITSQTESLLWSFGWWSNYSGMWDMCSWQYEFCHAPHACTALSPCTSNNSLYISTICKDGTFGPTEAIHVNPMCVLHMWSLLLTWYSHSVKSAL